MKLSINGKNYQLNTERALELGVLKLESFLPEDIRPGLQVNFKGASPSTIIQVTGKCEGDGISRYKLAGVDGNQFDCYAGQDQRTAEEMANYLNTEGYSKGWRKN
jgi:hypothetical protein